MMPNDAHVCSVWSPYATDEYYPLDVFITKVTVLKGGGEDVVVHPATTDWAITDSHCMRRE